MRTVVIRENALKTMKEDALRTFPDECCGFFFGDEQEGRHIITEARPVENAKEGDKRRRFEIHPVDYNRAELYAINSGLTLLGIYHSHPLHPAFPSEHDRAVALPVFSYIILSVFPDEIRDITSHHLNDNREFVREIIEIETLTSDPQ